MAIWPSGLFNFSETTVAKDFKLCEEKLCIDYDTGTLAFTTRFQGHPDLCFVYLVHHDGPLSEPPGESHTLAAAAPL